jgi:hypothetical protein
LASRHGNEMALRTVLRFLGPAACPGPWCHQWHFTALPRVVAATLFIDIRKILVRLTFLQLVIHAATENLSPDGKILALEKEVGS